MEGGVLLGVRVSNNLTDKINFQCFQEFGKKSDHADGKSTTSLVSHKKFSPIRRLDQEISALQVGAFMAVDLMVGCLNEILPRDRATSPGNRPSNACYVTCTG